MKQTRFRTVQSFLLWLESKTNKKLYIKVHSDGSGEIGDANEDKSLFNFSNHNQLARVLDRLVEKHNLEEKNN